METKKWYQSNTVQVAILQAISGVIIALIADNPVLQDVGYIAMVKSIIDFLLRAKSTTQIV